MYDKVRSALDALGEPELLALRKSVRDSPDGSTHEMEGVQLTREQLLQLVNQALPVAEE